MTYRLQVNEPIAKGVSRIGVEQLEVAQARLASRNDVAAAIHDTRRCLKRLRALLRLVRPALPPNVYRREANRLAGVGRLLADARDHHVMQQTLAKLGERFDDLPAGIGIKLTRLMANGAGPKQSGASAQSRRRALAALQQAHMFFARIGRRDIGFEQAAAGLERSYRRARRAFSDAYENASDEAFHEWRKAVQQHWRHMQLLSRVWPDVMGGRASEAKELSRLLGEDHDIHVLLTFASERGKATLPEGELASLVALGRSLQAELREQAKPRGARLFAERASDLSERIGLYWHAARDLKVVASHHDEKGPAAPKSSKPAKPKAAVRRTRVRQSPQDQAASRGSSGPGSSRPGR
jgi:CHAD domain-containing protein